MVAVITDGSAGTSIAKLLILDGFNDVILCNRKGILEYDDPSLDKYKKEIAKITNPRKIKRDLKKALNGWCKNSRYRCG